MSMQVTEEKIKIPMLFNSNGTFGQEIILFSAFFLSGMSALVFQIVWVRMLTRYLGSTTSATATVLCVFMGGLAVGAYASGRLADRIKRILVGYAIIEICTALAALLVSFAFIATFGRIYLSLYSLFGDNGLYLSMARVVFSMLCLFPPTFLMGATLPLLVAFVTRHNYQFQNGLGRLYSINTFGAVLGVFITGFLLLGLFGETFSLFIAAFLDFIAAALAVGLHLKLKNANQTAQRLQTIKKEQRAPLAYASRIRNWSRIAIFVSGFTALAYEILWSRFLMLPLRTSIYAFSLMLGLFLIGIACGSWLSTRSLISKERPVSTFAVIEILIGFLTVFGMLAFAIFGKISKGFTFIPSLGIITSIMMVLPVAVAFGWQFPVAVRCCISDSNLPGKATGWAYAANTLGAILGSITVGFILIPFIGTTRTMVLLAFLNILLGGILLWIRPQEERRKQPLFSYGLIAGFIAICFMVSAPYKSVMYERVQRFLGAKAEMYALYEDLAGIVVPAGSPNNPLARHLFTNGVGMTALVSETKLMAHLPMALAKDPRNILVICFGMGTSLRSASRYPGVRVDIDAVDIVPSVFDCFGDFHRDADRVIKQPNVSLHADDGRNFLLASQKLYDVITIDPAPPVYSAGTVNLYTHEFLELCKSRITESGIVCLWVPPGPKSELLMIMKTFANVFPGSSLWGGLKMPGFYLIGGYRSFAQTTESNASLAQRLSKISDLGEWDDLYRDEIMLKQLYLLGPELLHEMVKDVPEVTDNHPYTEFPLWRGIFTREVPQLNAIAIRQFLKRGRRGYHS